MRVQIGEKIVRVFSIFCNHPSEIPEKAWTLLNVNGESFIVDPITRQLLSECECQLLIDEKEKDKDEPTIAAIEMRVLRKGEKQLQNDATEDTSEDTTKDTTKELSGAASKDTSKDTSNNTDTKLVVNDVVENVVQDITKRVSVMTTSDAADKSNN